MELSACCQAVLPENLWIIRTGRLAVTTKQLTKSVKPVTVALLGHQVFKSF
jgi:hypothetical protein